jgi:hypothetical protein
VKYPEPVKSILKQFTLARNRRLISSFYIRKVKQQYFQIVVLLQIDRAAGDYNRLKPLLESKGCQVGDLNEYDTVGRFTIDIRLNS